MLFIFNGFIPSFIFLFEVCVIPLSFFAFSNLTKSFVDIPYFGLIFFETADLTASIFVFRTDFPLGLVL